MLAFEEGWMAALQALKVPEDSPLMDPSQMPFPSLSLAFQNPLAPINEEETTSMRELVDQIDSHVELVDMEVSNNPSVGDQSGKDL